MVKLNLKNFVRKNIQNLTPYSSARDEFKGDKATFLDANENPFGELNRYPDPYQLKLKSKVVEIKNVPIENIFVGNGSDEVIDLILRIFCEPGKDKILTCPPTYGMYEVSANINDVQVLEIPLDEHFQLDLEKIQNAITDNSVKIIFLCSPNNPTGNKLENIDVILDNFEGIVFVDEAYIDFNSENSFNQKLDNYPNLIVSQTFSKAWGLAGARVGLAFASQEIIEFLNKVKPPYNVSELNQKAVLNALENIQIFEENLYLILQQRTFLINEFTKIPAIKKIYPTDANFILIQLEKATEIYQKLVAKNIVTRDRSKVIKDCLRITVGSPEENKMLLIELNALLK